MTDRTEEKVLVVGATGFLGPALVEELALAGFQVICGVRNIKKAARQLDFPGVKFMEVDLNRDISPETWLSRLREHKVDRVVNNVGIANSFGGQSLENVNVLAPMAMFKATMRHLDDLEISLADGIIPRVIQISTTGVEWPDCSKFPYPASKLRVEEQLGRLAGLPHVIIRPNIIYEPERGHLLLEQIAKIPAVFYIGEALIQPIHCREVAIGVARLLTRKMQSKQATLRASGPEPMAWRQVFRASSDALGKTHICYCRVPLKLAQLATAIIQRLPKKILYRLGILSKMDPETMVMMTKGSTGSNRQWLNATGLQPIHLGETYRRYRKGADEYSDFIESIRKVNSTTADQ